MKSDHKGYTGGVASFRFGSKGSLPINIVGVIDLFIYKCKVETTMDKMVT